MIDVSDPAAMLAEANRRAQLRARGAATFDESAQYVADHTPRPILPPPAPRGQLLFPVAFTLPWSALVSENRRFCARDNRIFMTPEYKAARARTVGIVRRFFGAFEPAAVPLTLTARVWVPDRRVHDVANLSGATLNALKQLIYTDDRWVYDNRWIRAGVDVDSPRGEITITRFVGAL